LGRSGRLPANLYMSIFTRAKISAADRFTLSNYLPPNTTYFYGFPAGEDSNFFNTVHPWKEELVAARPLVCAGQHIKVLTFGATNDGTFKENVIPFPSNISESVEGHERNEMIKAAIKNLIPKKSLIMAQPYLDESLRDYFQIDPRITNFVNDKSNIRSYVDSEFLPRVYATFANGEEFNGKEYDGPLPCVIKVASSSSGDGVRICKNWVDFQKAKADFEHLNGVIFIEEFINAVENIGVQFGISYDPNGPMEIIGFNQQFTNENGNYLGGVIDPNKKISALARIYDVLLTKILPKVRAQGWYGVGGMDVLIDVNDKFYFIDPNFRMTAAFAYVYLMRHGEFKSPMMTFMGVFHGNENDFKEKILSVSKLGSANKPMLRIIALTKANGFYKFNAGMFFDSYKDIAPQAKKLIELGVSASTLKRVVEEQKNTEVRGHTVFSKNGKMKKIISFSSSSFRPSS